MWRAEDWGRSFEVDEEPGWEINGSNETEERVSSQAAFLGEDLEGVDVGEDGRTESVTSGSVGSAKSSKQSARGLVFSATRRFGNTVAWCSSSVIVGGIEAREMR